MSSSSHWLKLCRILHRTCVSRFIRRFFYVGDSPYLMSKKIVFNEICCLVQIYILYTHINFCYLIKKIKHTHTHTANVVHIYENGIKKIHAVKFSSEISHVAVLRYKTFILCRGYLVAEGPPTNKIHILKLLPRYTSTVPNEVVTFYKC